MEHIQISNLPISVKIYKWYLCLMHIQNIKYGFSDKVIANELTEILFHVK